MEIDDRVHALEVHVNAMNAELTHRIERAKYHVRLRAVIFGVLSLFVIGYMTWLTQTISRVLTPEDVVATAYYQIVRQLPVISRDLQGSLQEAAPEIVSQVLRGIESAIPGIRQSVQTSFYESVDVAFAEMNRRLQEDLPVVLEGERELLASLSGVVDEEQLDQLAGTLAIDLEQHLERHGMDEFMVDWWLTEKLWKLNEQLVRLHQDGVELDEVERLEKRLIELAVQALEVKQVF